MATAIAKISNLDETNEVLRFTLNSINVSYANAIRRVLLADVPCIVFRTQPYEENRVNIHINKTRLNNELIKQRISCIPIHVDDTDNFPYEDYVVELDKVNDTNSIIYATTEDFKVKNIKMDKYLESADVKKMFPPDLITGDYIDIVRLRPKLSDDMDPEYIKLSAKLSIGYAREDGAFNVVSTCSYGNTMDAIKIKEVWDEKEQELKKTYSKEEIEFMKKDWMLLDAKRLFIEDSFDFTIESVGIYTNYKLMELACLLIIKKLYTSLESLKNNNDLISVATDTMENCYNIKLENEDYTVGKIIEYYLYSKYFEEKKEVNFVGFLKKHPHDTFSTIKISFKEMTKSKDDIIFMIEEGVNYSILLLNSIKEYFNNGD